MDCKWTNCCRFATTGTIYAYRYTRQYKYVLTTLLPMHLTLRHPVTLLQLSCPKALLLAGTDRLDRALTIGQMQVGRSCRGEGRGMGRADVMVQG